MDSGDLGPKKNNREWIVILRPILLGIVGGITYVATNSISYGLKDLGGYTSVFGTLLFIWVLIVGSLALRFRKEDLQKIRLGEGNLEERLENKYQKVSYYLDNVVLIGVIIGIGYFFYILLF